MSHASHIKRNYPTAMSHTMAVSFSRPPWITLFILISALIISAIPFSLETLCFDQTQITNGQWWRLISGHFVHSSTQHLVWDLFAFTVFSGILESISRQLLFYSLLISMMLLDLILFSSIGLDRYCGLSGLLFAPMSIALWKHLESNDGWLGAAPLIIMISKLVFELFNQEHLFATTSWPPYFVAHWVGVISGGIALILYKKNRDHPP